MREVVCFFAVSTWNIMPKCPKARSHKVNIALDVRPSNQLWASWINGIIQSNIWTGFGTREMKLPAMYQQHPHIQLTRQHERVPYKYCSEVGGIPTNWVICLLHSVSIEMWPITRMCLYAAYMTLMFELLLLHQCCVGWESSRAFSVLLKLRNCS